MSIRTFITAASAAALTLGVSIAGIGAAHATEAEQEASGGVVYATGVSADGGYIPMNVWSAHDPNWWRPLDEWG